MNDEFGMNEATYGSQTPLILFNSAVGQYEPKGQASIKKKTRNLKEIRASLDGS